MKTPEPSVFPGNREDRQQIQKSSFSEGKHGQVCWPWSQAVGGLSSRPWDRASGGQGTVVHGKTREALHFMPMLLSIVQLALGILLLFYQERHFGRGASFFKRACSLNTPVLNRKNLGKKICVLFATY